MEVMEVMRHVLLCILEVVEGGIGWLEAMEAVRRVLLCILEALEFSKFAGDDGGDVSRTAL